MRESVGNVMLYNVIIIFIVIIFAFLGAIISYYRAYKVNSSIIVILEKYEGYTPTATAEINLLVRNIGYNVTKGNRCLVNQGEGVLVNNNNQGYCIYRYEKDFSEYHDTYGVTTYISWEFPLIGQLVKIPIFSKTDNIYRFGE